MDLCKNDSDCGRQDPNSECRYDAAAALRKCACKSFYVNDSSFGSCVPGPDAGCDIKVRVKSCVKSTHIRILKFFVKCVRAKLRITLFLLLLAIFRMLLLSCPNKL